MKLKKLALLLLAAGMLCGSMLVGCRADNKGQPEFSAPDANVVWFKSSDSLEDFFAAAEQSDQELLQFLANTPFEEFSDDGILLYSFEQGNRAPVETFLSYMETLPVVAPAQGSTQVMEAFKYYVDNKPFPWFDLTYKNSEDTTSLSYRFTYSAADEDIRHMTNDEYQANLKRKEQYVWAELDGIKFKLYQSDEQSWAAHGFFLLDSYYVTVSVAESALPADVMAHDCVYFEEFQFITRH